MGLLLSIQRDDNDPIEYTHFDCWDDEIKGESTEMKRAELIESIFKCWDETLETTICMRLRTRHNSVLNAIITLGEMSVFDVAILAVLEMGFDVYSGDTCIEIYKGENEND